MLNHAAPRVLSARKEDEYRNPATTDQERWLAAIVNLGELEIRHDAAERILWQFMKPTPRPSFTPGLLADFTTVLDTIEQTSTTHRDLPVRYLVTGSTLPNVYNLGGDLERFQRLILTADRDGLRRYAHSCIDPLYRNATHLGMPLTSIALVQGDALGGGFELALSHDVIIAEQSAKFGLPEVLFNLFPGMGAYTFLSRRIGSAKAQRLMTSGRLYSAGEMQDLGIVDVVAEDGAGMDAAYAFIDGHRRSSKGRLAVARLPEIAAPLSRQEMIDITELWVETALSLDARDLRKMGHLVAAQDRRSSGRTAAAVADKRQAHG